MNIKSGSFLFKKDQLTRSSTSYSSFKRIGSSRLSITKFSIILLLLLSSSICNDTHQNSSQSEPINPKKPLAPKEVTIPKDPIKSKAPETSPEPENEINLNEEIKKSNKDFINDVNNISVHLQEEEATKRDLYKAEQYFLKNKASNKVWNENNPEPTHLIGVIAPGMHLPRHFDKANGENMSPFQLTADGELQLFRFGRYMSWRYFQKIHELAHEPEHVKLRALGVDASYSSLYSFMVGFLYEQEVPILNLSTHNKVLRPPGATLKLDLDSKVPQKQGYLNIPIQTDLENQLLMFKLDHHCNRLDQAMKDAGSEQIKKLDSVSLNYPDLLKMVKKSPSLSKILPDSGYVPVSSFPALYEHIETLRKSHLIDNVTVQKIKALSLGYKYARFFQDLRLTEVFITPVIVDIKRGLQNIIEGKVDKKLKLFVGTDLHVMALNSLFLPNKVQFKCFYDAYYAHSNVKSKMERCKGYNSHSSSWFFEIQEIKGKHFISLLHEGQYVRVCSYSLIHKTDRCPLGDFIKILEKHDRTKEFHKYCNFRIEDTLEDFEEDSNAVSVFFFVIEVLAIFLLIIFLIIEKSGPIQGGSKKISGVPGFDHDEDDNGFEMGKYGYSKTNQNQESNQVGFEDDEKLENQQRRRAGSKEKVLGENTFDQVESMIDEDDDIF